MDREDFPFQMGCRQDGFLRRRHEKKIGQESNVSPSQTRQGVSPGQRAATLELTLDKYLNHLAVKGYADSTLRVRRVHMRMFLCWCSKSGIYTPFQVTKTVLEGYQRFLFDYRKKCGRPLAVASQHARLAPLKVWFRWMAHRNHIAEDPAPELELPRVGYKLPSVLNKGKR